VDNPWPQWPRSFRVDYGQEEAAAIFGKDPRQFQVQTKRILGDDKGHARAIEVVEVRFAAQAAARPRSREVPGTVREICPQNLVLLGHGFSRSRKAGLLSELGVKLDGRGNVRGSTETSKPAFPAFSPRATMSRGQSLVVWAIAEGRDAARRIPHLAIGQRQNAAIRVRFRPSRSVGCRWRRRGLRPMAHTTSDWPRDMSPAAKTPGTLVCLFPSTATLPRPSSFNAEFR